MAKKHRIRKPGVVPYTRRRHAENARRTEHQVTGETPFAFARKVCPKDGMISEFGCFLPFRASRLTKAPAKEGNPEHDAQARNRNCCFACRNRGRHAPRARGGPRGEGEGAQAQRAHVAQNDSESSTGRGGKRPVLGRVKRGEPLESVCPRVILYDVYYPVSRIIFLPFPNVSRKTFVRLPAAPHGAPREPVRPCRRAERGPCAFC